MNIKQFISYRPDKVTNLPLSLRSVGHATLHSYLENQVKRILNFIQIIWCLEGKGMVVYDKQKITISSNQVLSIMPGKTHQLYASTANWEICWITIDGLHACDLVKSFDLEHRAVKSGNCPIDLFDKMSSIVLQSDRTSLLEASSLCYTFLTKAAHLAPRSANQIDKAMEIIRENAINPNIGVALIADQLGIERTIFSKKFMSQTGISPKDYLDSCRLEKIMSLLANTDISIKQISSQTGFSNANYLAKFFRKKMSMSPLTFRKQAQTEL